MTERYEHTGEAGAGFDGIRAGAVNIDIGGGRPDNGRIVTFTPAERIQRQTSIRASAMVFQDPVSKALQHDLDRVAPSQATVLIIGETGTGKELIARYIHANSTRAAGPFAAVNCGALSDTLAEAELFGSEKGAFTGSVKTQPGWFEVAHGGTLFLDEVGDLPMPLQVKLLRVLQEREVVRVGSRHPIPIDIRVIAATNVDLEAAIQAKRFREDLYFRLNVAAVTLPPLRERLGDVEPLAGYFLDLYRDRLDRPDIAFSPQALRRLRRHDWPGNIRELENVIHNAVLLARGTQIEATDLRLAVSTRSRDAETVDLESGVRMLIERAIVDGDGAVFDRAVRTMVRTAFDLADGNQVRAAEALGISRNAFRTQLSHLGAIPARKRARAVEAEPPSAPVPAPAWGAGAGLGASAGVGRPRGGLAPLCIGYQKFGTSSLLKARGGLDDQLAELGFSVSWTEFPAGPQLLDGLFRGLVDFCATGEAPPVFAQAAGAPLVYVGYEPPAPKGEAILVPDDSPVVSVAGLRGRRVALNRGSNVHYFLLRALQAHGLGIKDIILVDLPADQALRALRDGQVDAWAIWDPLLTSVQIMGGTRVLIDGAGLVANRQFYLSTASFSRNHPEVIHLLLRQLGNVGQYAATHAAEMARRMESELGIAAPALEIAFSRLTYGARPLDAQTIRHQQDIADTFLGAGLLPSAIAVNSAVWSG